MNRERDQKIEELYHRALDLNAEQRAALFASVEPDIRREVESLLGYDSGDASLRPAIPPGLLTDAPLPPRIGHYRILSRIGEGGMGVVYKAEQESPRRVVALKVIRPGWCNTELERRFERESQALGRLRHPGIAQIYEAGTADTGFGEQPYFAMEFIHGSPLGQYAQQHSLGMREKLELVAKICDAVHHAHQRGIIHRDLKPGNVLVDENGEPKVLDFGVARITDVDANTTRKTEFGQIVGTLAYMSPEQVMADPLELDTRSDVYSLGVILYELLSGRLPYQVSKQLPEAVRTIRETDPNPLSSINRLYRGDIETIVAKALDKEKSRRYDSAAELALDIRRHLHDEPVAARPPSRAYQLQKFARRHRALVVGTAAVFVVLVAGVVVSTMQAIRANRASDAALAARDRAASAEQQARMERDRALNAEQSATSERNKAVTAQQQAIEERNRALAEKRRADEETATALAVREFLQNDLLAQATIRAQAGPGAKPDPDLKVRTALDRAAARISGKFEKRPLVEASIRLTIANTYRDLGLYAEAQRQVEQALELRRSASKADDADVLDAQTLLADLYARLGKLMEAEALHARTLETRRRTLGEDHPDTLTSLDRLGLVLENLGRYAEAEALHARELAILRRVRGEDHQDTVRAMGNLAIDYTRQGKHAAAEPLNVKVLEVLRRQVGDEHPQTLTAMNNLALVYTRQSKLELSEKLQLEVLSTQRRLLGEEHDRTLLGMSNLATLYVQMGRHADAETLLAKTVSILRRTMGEAHPSTLLTMSNLGAVYYFQGKLAQSEQTQSHILESRRRVLGDKHPSTVNSMRGLAMVYRRQERYSEAEALMAKVVDAQHQIRGIDQATTPDDMIYLSEARVLQGKYEVESLLREAIGLFDQRKIKTWKRDYAQSLLGVTLGAHKQYAEAEKLLLEGFDGLNLRKSTLPAFDGAVMDRSGAWIVKLYRDWDRPDQAAQWQAKLASKVGQSKPGLPSSPPK